MPANKDVLVVEDDADIRLNLSQVLQMEGYVVHLAVDGVDALAVLSKLPKDHLPCCILLDLQMPRMTGNEFYNVLQSQYGDTWAKIPVVVATARGSLTDLPDIPKSVQRIRKPIELDELFRVLEELSG